MRNQAFSILTAGLAVVFAADGSADAAPAAGWDGVYVGATVGANISSGHFALPGDTGDVLLTDQDSRTAFTGGGLVGFNHQIGNYVLGIEGDVVGGPDKLNVTACTVFGGCWTPAHDSFTTFNRLKEGVTGHLRFKLGYAFGRTLVYAAGGYSVADTQLDLIGDCFNGTDPSSPTIYRFSRGKTVSGFNVGAGLERAVTDHVTVRAEYLYDDFGTQLYRGDGTEWNDRRIGLSNSTFRAAAAYRF